MSNKIRTYIKNVDDTDPLRLELNSTWIGAKPAYEVIGPPKSIEISKYFEPATETSIDHFYQKRQKIRVEKLAAFDANQGGIAVLDPFGNPIINTLSSTPQSFTGFVQARLLRPSSPGSLCPDIMDSPFCRLVAKQVEYYQTRALARGG